MSRRPDGFVAWNRSGRKLKTLAQPPHLPGELTVNSHRPVGDIDHDCLHFQTVLITAHVDQGVSKLPDVDASIACCSSCSTDNCLTVDASLFVCMTSHYRLLTSPESPTGVNCVPVSLLACSRWTSSLIIFLISATGGIENTSLSSSSNAKNGSHEFPEFLLEKFRNFGTWKKTEFPELQSLRTTFKINNVSNSTIKWNKRCFC